MRQADSGHTLRTAVQARLVERPFSHGLVVAGSDNRAAASDAEPATPAPRAPAVPAGGFGLGAAPTGGEQVPMVALAASAPDLTPRHSLHLLAAARDALRPPLFVSLLERPG